MNILMLIIVWGICYPPACEITTYLFHLRLKADNKPPPSSHDDYKAAAIHLAIYIAVILWLLSIYYGNNG